MANEFKVRNGVVVNGSGSTILDVQGSQGQLFATNDSLSGSLYSVKNNLGVPVIQAFSDATVKMGAFGAEAIRVSGSFTTATGSLLGTSSYAINALSASYALSSSYTLSSSFASLAVSASFAQTASATPFPLFPFTGSAQIIGRLIVTGSVTTTGSLSITGSVAFAYENPNGVWSVRNAMITARYSLAGAGTQNTTLGFGGFIAANAACTEAYNGFAWSAGGAMITARNGLAGAGLQNAALAFGGNTSPANVTCTEAYNGTAWSTGGAMITARTNLAGTGNQNAALAFGGISPTAVACTEAYNGISWTTGGSLITARQALAGAGTQNEALGFGGAAPTALACTEAYNGSTWSARSAMIIAKAYLGGAGVQNSALAFAGSAVLPTSVTCTESYNGTSWAVKNVMITARIQLAGAGTQAAALAFGGNNPANLACTEAFTVSPLQTFNYNPSTGNTFLSSSLNITGSISVSGSGVINNLTASVAVTASQATNVIPTFSKSITILNNGYLQQSDTGSYPVWRISFPITASQILAFSTSSLSPFSGSLVNISRNVSSSLLTTPLVLTSSTWVSSSVIPFPSFSAGDMLSFNFLTLTGSLTEIVIQINYIK